MIVRYARALLDLLIIHSYTVLLSGPSSIIIDIASLGLTSHDGVKCYLHSFLIGAVFDAPRKVCTNAFASLHSHFLRVLVDGPRPVL